MRNTRTFMGDFETTVYEGQKTTEVWASACVEFGTEDVKIFHSIDEQFKYFESLDCNIKCYYHNLKFDGMFWLSYLLVDRKFKQAYIQPDPNLAVVTWVDFKDMTPYSVRYSIGEMGQWYSITIKLKKHTITLLDSLKLLPFSVRRIGNAFGTKHKKLDMEYEGYRYAGCEITDEEQKYIANDVLVVKEALELMQDEGHNKTTIGSCCLAEYKKMFLTDDDWDNIFPDMYSIEFEGEGYDNYGKYINASYKGGWCYVVSGKENQVKRNGVTADVNSLYPSMMSSESGNAYPVGKPKYWKGDIPSWMMYSNKYWFVRLRTRFKIKKNKLPFLQVKHTWLYPSNLCLESSDIYDRRTGELYDYYIDVDGNKQPAIVELVLTMTDYKLMLEHYDLYDTEYIDGCYFESVIGIFDEYIDKYKKIKVESKGAKRELAKLFLNNLYGKMASNTNSSFKVAFVKEDESLGFYTVIEHNKTAGYIPVGSAITSYARNFTIRTAQMNYYGKHSRGFIYADTDSIHCDLSPAELKGVNVHPTNFCCWKLEALWDKAIFARQKTYIEHVVAEDMEAIDEPYYNIKCAGMPERCKQLFNKSISKYKVTDDDDFNEEEKEFIEKRRVLTDFKIGLKVPSKLMPKRIKGGVILVSTSYEMR